MKEIDWDEAADEAARNLAVSRKPRNSTHGDQQYKNVTEDWVIAQAEETQRSVAPDFC